MYLLIEEGLGREGVEDGGNVLSVDDRNGEVGGAAGTAERIAESSVTRLGILSPFGLLLESLVLLGLNWMSIGLFAITLGKT